MLAEDPYFIRGYTGHAPGYRYRCGGSFSNLSHKLFLDPCIPHSSKIVLNNIHVKGISKPDPRKLDICKRREKTTDVKYKFPMLVGYDGHVPRRILQCGDRFAIEALDAVAEFGKMHEVKVCEQESLRKKDVPFSGEGNFYLTTPSRMAIKSHYVKPLPTVTPRQELIRTQTCGKPPKEPYTKETTPLFLECGDPRKYITSGYSGHISLMHSHFGHSNEVVTHGALCEFLERRRRFNKGKWCPPECLAKCPLPLAAYDDCSCPAQIDYSIYDTINGMMPTYAGHVPGYRYSCGARFTHLSTNSKNWLEYHRKDNTDPTPARIR